MGHVAYCNETIYAHVIVGLETGQLEDIEVDEKEISGP
jgi:hypothetical protein